MTTALPGGNSVWITWFPHRRTDSICGVFGVPLETFDGRGRTGIWRRIDQIGMTVARMLRAKEEVIFIQNPSLGLTLVGCLIRKIRRFQLVIDAHNEGIRPFNRKGWMIRWITTWVVRTADVTIVTNTSLSNDVLAFGGAPVVLPDPMPQLHCDVAETLVPDECINRRPYVFVIATYAADEPIEEILCAAQVMQDSVDFVFSGDPRKWRKGRASMGGANVRFPGYVSEAEFVSLLGRATCIVDLSKKPDCLVCGAYEALSLGQPAILTQSQAARELFPEGFEFVDNSPSDIVSAIEKIMSDLNAYRAGVRRSARRYEEMWDQLAAIAAATIWCPTH